MIHASDVEPLESFFASTSDPPFRLYALISKSRLKAATRFKKWIFEVVLPSVRKTGQFRTTQRMQLQDRETRLVELACMHFKQDDAMVILGPPASRPPPPCDLATPDRPRISPPRPPPANEKLKTFWGGNSGGSGPERNFFPISVALDLSGEYMPQQVQTHRVAVVRMAAKLYRETLGVNPKKTQQNVGGRLCAVNAYWTAPRGIRVETLVAT